jgi:hypothetical protein
METVAISISMFPDGRLDRENAARYLGLKPKTLAMHASAGTGPKFLKCGQRVFYMRDDLDAWIGRFGKFSSTAQARTAQASA